MPRISEVKWKQTKPNYTKNIFITNSCTITKKKFTAKLFVHHNIWRTKQKKKIGRYKLTFISLLKKQVNIYKSHTQNETQSDKIIHHNSMQISHHTIWLQVMQLRKSQWPESLRMLKVNRDYFMKLEFLMAFFLVHNAKHFFQSTFWIFYKILNT